MLFAAVRLKPDASPLLHSRLSIQCFSVIDGPIIPAQTKQGKNATHFSSMEIASNLEGNQLEAALICLHGDKMISRGRSEMMGWWLNLACLSGDGRGWQSGPKGAMGCACVGC